jgi:hypothetical protein
LISSEADGASATVPDHPLGIEKTAFRKGAIMGVVVNLRDRDRPRSPLGFREKCNVCGGRQFELLASKELPAFYPHRGLLRCSRCGRGVCDVEVQALDEAQDDGSEPNTIASPSAATAIRGGIWWAAFRLFGAIRAGSYFVYNDKVGAYYVDGRPLSVDEMLDRGWPSRGQPLKSWLGNRFINRFARFLANLLRGSSPER